MDETSEFDSQMQDIILASQSLMSPEEIHCVKTYVSTNLLKKKINDAGELLERFSDGRDWDLSDLLREHEFTSMMKARLVNKIFGLSSNPQIQELVVSCRDILPELFAEPSGKFQFAKAYEDNIIVFRNKLAHVKQLNAKRPVLIGTINGTEHKCDSQFCSMMRETLIRYGHWFDEIYDRLEKRH